MPELATAARRRDYLDGLADDALAEQDASEARRKETNEAAAVAEKRRQELTERRRQIARKRLAAVSHCEALAKKLAEALRRIHPGFPRWLPPVARDRSTIGDSGRARA